MEWRLLMPDLFVITDDIRSLAQSAIDSMLNQLGKPCKLIYEPVRTPCNNCFLDTTTNLSSGQYNGTGPMSFTRGKCPVCGGSGYLPGETERSDVVTMTVIWKPNVYKYFAPNVQLPDSLIVLKGYVTDLPKVLQAKYVIPDYLNQVYQSSRFVLFEAPHPQGSIVKNRYFRSFWKRYGT
jgi:hypothetical protein